MKLIKHLLQSVVILFSIAAGAQETSGSDKNQPLWYFLSSLDTDQVFLIDQSNGALLKVLEQTVPGPFASFVSRANDFYVAAQHSGEVYRFDGQSGLLKDVFIKAGSGGLKNPTAPILTPDGKYMIVGDLALNGYLRYDGHTGEFIDVFAVHGPKPIDGPFMPVFSPWPEHKGKIFIASGNTNSVQIYNIETTAYEGDFVKPESGGLKIPIGLVFGPDGNLYAASSGTNSVKKYNGRTGEYMEDFVKSASGGLKSPRASEFGGPNSDLYVVSNDSNNVLRFDRVTGEFLGVSASGAAYGFKEPRGLMFSRRPFTFAEAFPSKIQVSDERKEDRFVPVNIVFRNVQGLIADDTKVELLSITEDGTKIDAARNVRDVKFGTDDRHFLLRARTNGHQKHVYTVTYRISRVGEGWVMCTTDITVMPVKSSGDHSL